MSEDLFTVQSFNERHTFNESNPNITYTKLVGVTFNNRQQIIKGLTEGELLVFERQPKNEFDKNAILALRSDGKEVGHISRELAQQLAPALDNGAKYICEVKNITGTGKEIKGVNIGIKKYKREMSLCILCCRSYETEREANLCCRK